VLAMQARTPINMTDRSRSAMASLLRAILQYTLSGWQVSS
jgi:hypothetical protein